MLKIVNVRNHITTYINRKQPSATPPLLTDMEAGSIKKMGKKVKQTPWLDW
jgi:hypothetical protein